MSATVVDVTDADFEAKAVKAAGPVLAVFRAEWSGVCRALDPILADVAQQYANRLTVARLDIDKSPQTPPKYNITAIPTLHVFKGGKIVATRIGPSTNNDVVRLVTGHL
ncbi:thiol reductase thioredoxin [Streptomyces sp. WAC 06783]|uniref:thioredoxin family protein n=1 Tax=unclassified Streptomyces TaxID=2593676 RepID=UPI000F747311|nr:MULTISPECIES: thioredoxin domain-containing protein [unclassified Streptomyces]RSO03835.1 thiol reductase thioredoxin [Streptomyces sp. WAC 06783]RSO40258.1 thiol reductase thioredoxin [Streptomyces sp. WAC 06725]